MPRLRLDGGRRELHRRRVCLFAMCQRDTARPARAGRRGGGLRKIRRRGRADELTNMHTGWSYRTTKGTFRIERVFLGGSPHAVLWLDDTYLGPYSYAPTAAESIARGDHDRVLGFAASKLNVPAQLHDWMPIFG